jgi:hypothetical protein
VTRYGQAVHPIFCNLLSMVYRESPLCSWGSAFGCESTESLPNCLIKLLPKALLLSHPTTFLEAHCQYSGGGVFTSLSLAQSPQPTGRATPARCHQMFLSEGRDPLFQQTEEVRFGCTKEPGKAQEPTWQSHSSDW